VEQVGRRPASAAIGGARAALPAWGDEAGFVGEYNGLGAVAEAELGQDAADVGFGGLLGDDQVSLISALDRPRAINAAPRSPGW
jgi:hypothetical protein